MGDLVHDSSDVKRRRSNREVKEAIKKIDREIDQLAEANNPSDELRRRIDELRSARRALEWVIGDSETIVEGRERESDEYVDGISNETVLVNNDDNMTHIIPSNRNSHSLREVFSEDSSLPVITACGESIDTHKVGSRTVGKGNGICDDCIRAYKRFRETESRKELTGSRA